MTHPRPVIVKSYWPGIGRLIDVRIKIGDTYQYTTRIRKDGQTTLDVVRQTRKDFRRAS